MDTRKALYMAAAVAVGSLAFANTSGAQQHTKHAATVQIHVKGDTKLKSEAKVSEADAIATAQKEVPDGKIESGEIEREGGKLIYSFDIKVPKKSGVEEVNVDAMTGTVVKKEHETAKAEKAEMKKEANEMKAEAKKESKEMKKP
ncbi:MAG TPA: PepSY domain-containing protein [Gemmatimonadaceae bacterium]